MAEQDAGSDRRWRWVSDAVLVAVISGVVLALFGGFIVEEPQNPWVQLGLGASGVIALLLAGVWLDHREARREGAAGDPGEGLPTLPVSGYAVPPAGADD